MDKLSATDKAFFLSADSSPDGRTILPKAKIEDSKKVAASPVKQSAESKEHPSVEPEDDHSRVKNMSSSP